MKKKTFRETIQFYLIGSKTIPGKLIDIAILLLNLIFITIFVLETYDMPQTTKNLLWQIEIIIVIFFIIEYIARIYGSQNRIKHIFNFHSIIDLITILPTLTPILFPAKVLNISILKIMRVFKALRIFRFLRFTRDPYSFFGKITTHLLRVVRLIITILIIFFVASGLFWQIESPVNNNVENFGDAFYFTVVALTTVGFGDIIPVTNAGRWIVILMIISGIILIPWQASKIIKEWAYVSRKRIVCSKCGLKYHDKDASHCKSCGNIIYQEFAGN